MSLGTCAVFLWICSEAFPLLAASFIPEVINSPEKVGCSFQNYDHREGDVRWSLSFPPNIVLNFFILFYTSLCLAVKVEVRIDGYIRCDCFLSTD